ncbi:uncharacterized protein LOC129005912 [Macrosteles quadrilineatus]|uniref:uncharacterized protein LOC129005912 n=1 Tax=Macrosteles quadrilineatus TaxID=74068 RepID=UPI0023E2EAFF|nr:uncharacterized protein LOC129005912 [Macrosteles quadrilineatus]
MPRKKSNIGRTTRKARQHAAIRAAETSEDRDARLEDQRVRASTSRAAETHEQRDARLEDQRVRASTSRAAETPEQRDERIEDLRVRASTSRSAETPEQRDERIEDLRVRASTSRAAETPEDLQVRRETERLRQIQTRIRGDLNKAAFEYDKTYDYKIHRDIAIGLMTTLCPYCHALKFQKESLGMCCSNGKVNLPPLSEPPEPLQTYIAGVSRESKHFLQHIRKYNSCFQMTSFGASSIVRYGNFMPTFKVQGQVYHQIGSLLPLPQEDPQFLQIYFIDNVEEELDRRCAFSLATNREIIAELRASFHEHNSLVRDFKSALENAREDDFKVIIRADKAPLHEHARRFNAQMAPEVGAVIVGTEITRRDIVISMRDETKQRVSETHRSYDALQYPIMFPRGEDGYNLELYQTNPTTGAATTKKVSCKAFYAYRIMIRDQQTNHILMCRQLFQQFIVDMYAKVESERLNYIRFNQSKLRVEDYIHLRDAVANDGVAADIGQKVILPSSYTGSPRHMHEYAQDALTYVRKYGRPDLFITFTCNPSWKEITDLLLPGQQPCHRHDITARVFKQKLIRFIDIITKNHIYGETRCWMYSVEWQKRGLPHAHVLIWLVEKIVPTQIDDIISAELPNPEEDPELFEIVRKNMIHGPCGLHNPHSPCMKDGKCTKKYPRAMYKETQTGGDGYPQYRRRIPEEGGFTTNIKIKNMDFETNNQWIVPYSPLLLKTFNAHINVEYCNSVKSIKYICKYVNKGSDMAVFGFGNPNVPNDEIDQFLMGRYISSNEAVWRILGFEIHERFPAVMHLSVHLENGQRVYFTEENVAQRAVDPPNTTLTAFFELCRADEFAKTLLYHEVPHYYTWNPRTKKFCKRKRGVHHPEVDGIYSTGTLGRVYTVHPSNSECYYLRMLLHVVKGPTSFQDLKIVEGQVCQTFREACSKLGLLECDLYWNNTLAEASETRHPHQIRTLFAIILTTCAPSNPHDLWERHKESMSEDILLRVRRDNPDQEVQYTENIFNEALISLEDMCISINNKILNELGLLSPERNNRNDVIDKELLRETQYDLAALKVYVEIHKHKLTDDQQLAYDTVMQHIRVGNGGLLFIDAPGGTGKTFLLNLILAEIRMNKNIALAVASSGIAATLLDGGRTAHSAFKLPLNLNQATETPCNISKTSGMATVLKTCKLIIWDECTMAHKKGLEALDRTLRDFRNDQRPMGGALILLAGDFRQTLPVIPRSTPADELNACLKNSVLWRYVKKITLSTNMRVHLLEDDSAEHFAKQLLDLGRAVRGYGGLKTSDCTLLPEEERNAASFMMNSFRKPRKP